jgi:TRAP transporter 4TM/12TM fusion protein
MVSPLMPAEILLGSIFILLILEATRKVAGAALPIIALLFILYGLGGSYLPGMLSHAGYSWDSIVDLNFLGTEGAFGIPLGASATYIALFILFGSFLAKSGVGDLLMDISMGVAGHARGGPAKVSIIGSALHGMLSGSAVANVMTVGTSTIPLMKKIGYKATFAGGVEAAASAGSQIMPPVMGIVAFIMAQYTGIPYVQIALYALFPAILYFWGIGVMVHLEAVKLGLTGIPKKELPDWKASLKKKWHLLLPIFVLVALLMLDYSPSYAVSYSILSILIFSSLQKETRMNWRSILEAMEDGAKGMMMIGAATATAGIISGMFGLTGLGVRFTALLDDLSGGHLVLALILTAIASFILGMGLPPSASYIVQVAITIPALVGILQSHSPAVAEHALLLAHMFVMYFASIAVITPPDALASFAAAAIAKSNPMTTALTATKLAFVAYVIPFMFVLNPAYLMIGPTFDKILAVLTGFLGVVAFGVFFQGFLNQKLNWIFRFWALTAGSLMLMPNPILNIIGVLTIIVFFITVRRNRLTQMESSGKAKVDNVM